MPGRQLLWDGCVNVRDLGGIPTEDGRETRFGAIVRADSVRRLSGAGWEALVDYGVSRIVDLRWHDELEADPPADLPVELVHVSLFGEYDPEVGRSVDALAAAEPDGASATRAVYLEFLRRYHANFGDAVVAVAGGGDGAVVVHCAAGKDRTGLVVALLLRLAGVGVNAIADDYALSESSWAPFVGEWIAAAEDERERARRIRLSACPPEAIAGVLDDVERRHGTVRAYLCAGGATDADLDRVRARLHG